MREERNPLRKTVIGQRGQEVHPERTCPAKNCGEGLWRQRPLCIEGFEAAQAVRYHIEGGGNAERMEKYLSSDRVVQQTFQFLAQRKRASAEVCESEPNSLVVCIHDEVTRRQVEGRDGPADRSKLEYLH